MLQYNIRDTSVHPNTKNIGAEFRSEGVESEELSKLPLGVLGEGSEW